MLGVRRSELGRPSFAGRLGAGGLSRNGGSSLTALPLPLVLVAPRLIGGGHHLSCIGGVGRPCVHPAGRRRSRRQGCGSYGPLMDLRIFTEPQQGATYEQLLAVARTAEDAGYDAFFRSDHYLAMGGDGLPGPTDAWVTLAGLARETSRTRLGTLVTAGTFRLPGVLAITVAQVDQMSGGRVELGLGTGWYEQEHTAYGIPFPPRASGLTGSRSS